MRRGRLLVFISVALIVVITAIAFWPGLDGEFLNWDDGFSSPRTPATGGLGPDQLRWMFTTILAGHNMPVTWLTFDFHTFSIKL